jgi:hypothetical protein
MNDAARALAQEGQPIFSAWPYQSVQAYRPSWKPPFFNSTTYKVVMTPGKMTFDDIANALATGRTVVIGLFITDAFIQCSTSGLIVDASTDPERSAHAVLAVGHGLDQDGTDYLLVRNSWGLGWGIQGHAWISRNYASRQVRETAILA